METENELIAEANKRGYRSGTLIDYDGQLVGTDTLGSGEFKLINDSRRYKLIKYEKPLKNGQIDLNRRFDTVWDKLEGWVKIADKSYGVAF